MNYTYYFKVRIILKIKTRLNDQIKINRIHNLQFLIEYTYDKIITRQQSLFLYLYNIKNLFKLM